jgi:Flp pilus assembly protein TadG
MMKTTNNGPGSVLSRRGRSGLVTVEFAIIATTLFLILFGVMRSAACSFTLNTLAEVVEGERGPQQFVL